MISPTHRMIESPTRRRKRKELASGIIDAEGVGYARHEFGRERAWKENRETLFPAIAGLDIYSRASYVEPPAIGGCASRSWSTLEGSEGPTAPMENVLVIASRRRGSTRLMEDARFARKERSSRRHPTVFSARAGNREGPRRRDKNGYDGSSLHRS